MYQDFNDRVVKVVNDAQDTYNTDKPGVDADEAAYEVLVEGIVKAIVEFVDDPVVLMAHVIDQIQKRQAEQARQVAKYLEFCKIPIVGEIGENGIIKLY